MVTFGRRAVVPVQGDVYAQPLYAGNVTINGSPHNLVIVATQHDQVYGVDADSGQVLWHRDFLNPAGGVTSIPNEDVNCDDIVPEIGITGTPVIDPASQTVYVVVRTKETPQGGAAQYFQRLYALRLPTGQDRVSPTVISTPPDPGGHFGSAKFDPLLNNQRSALLLNQGQVYVAWASQCDMGRYQGWLMAFDATTLQLTAAWTPSPSGDFGGIWMGGSGPAGDESGDIYLTIGNGGTDVMTGGTNYGDSAVRLRNEGTTIAALDYFTPFDWMHLYSEDYDLGSNSPVLLPNQAGSTHQRLLIAIGKAGTAYLLDRDSLGHWHEGNDNQIVESFSSGGDLSFSTPAFFNNTLFVSLPGAPVRAFAYDPVTQMVDPTPSSTTGAITIGYPGSSPAVSANNGQNGILWVLAGAQDGVILRAFDATDLSVELYDSEMSPDRDRAGRAVKFTVPTVADGKVFVGAHNELDIYGLL